MPESLLSRITDGRTDLVFDFLAAGHPATWTDPQGVSLVQWCAYFGDVSAIRHLVLNGASLDVLGEDLGLNTASFHGHWRLCEFLIEHGADPNYADRENSETPLHAALCTNNRSTHDVVLKVLLTAGANPNRATRPGVQTEGFMRDVRTKGETPLHRAAAFGTEETIQLLLNAGAQIDARDMHGDSPLSWASWHLRPTPILRKLLYGNFRIHPDNRDMQLNLIGDPGT